MPDGPRQDATAAPFAGVELGGTKCIVMLACCPDEILEECRIETTSPAETMAGIEAALDRFIAFSALGIASFGPVGIAHGAADYGFVTQTPKPGWQHADVAGRLARRYGVPIGFHTDVTGAALGEGRWGAAQGLGDFAYVTVGTGVGVGLVAGGRPVDGMTHGELGHIRPTRRPGDDWPGHCPFHGACVEGLASGAAIAARTGRQGEQIGPDDPVWAYVVDALVQLLHVLVMTGVPRRIVLGGGVMNGNPHLFPRLRSGLSTSLGGYALRPPLQDLASYIVPAALGNNAGPLGAIVLAELAASD